MNIPSKEEIVKFNEKHIARQLSACERRKIHIDLKNPKTIQDKLNWLNIYDVNPLKWKCADKILLRDYCKEVLGEDLCIPILKVYKSVSEINWDELPSSFVIKCNHGSGMNIIVKDKKNFDRKSAVEKLDKWVHEDFSIRNGFESHYHWIEPRIFVEKLMSDDKQKLSLFDYKFWCFNGEPKFYTINEGHGHGPIVHYNMNQKKSELERMDYKVPKSLDYKQPSNFKEMVELSKKLSKPFKFVRVDFYEINGKTYLGELTFVPGVGYFKYKRDEDDRRIGDLLSIKD